MFQVEKECRKELEEISLEEDGDGTFSLRAKNTLGIYSNTTSLSSFNFHVSCMCVCVCVWGVHVCV